MPLDDLVDALDSGKPDEEVLPLITEEAAKSKDPDGCARRERPNPSHSSPM